MRAALYLPAVAAALLGRQLLVYYFKCYTTATNVWLVYRRVAIYHSLDNCIERLLLLLTFIFKSLSVK